MARNRRKICPGCSTVFRGSERAKTCSARCRKRVQRAEQLRTLGQQPESELEKLEDTFRVAVRRVESAVEPAFATEGGFVGEDAPQDKPQPQPTFITPTITPEKLQGQPSYSGVQAPIVSSPELPPEVTQPVQVEPPATPQFSPPTRNVTGTPRFSGARRFAPLAAGVVMLALALPLAIFLLSSHTTNNNQARTGSSTSSNQNQISNNQAFTTTISSISLNRDTVVASGSSLRATGKVALQNEVNSAAAFNIQNAAGDVLFNVDTTGKAISFGGPNNNIALAIAGAVTISGSLNVNTLTAGSATIGNTGVTLGTLTVCNTDGCIPNTKDAVTLQGENASFFTNASNLTTGTISDNRLSTNVALLNAAQTFTNTNIFKPTTNSTTVFQVQNAGGNTVFSTDTINGRVGIGTTTPGSALDILGTGLVEEKIQTTTVSASTAFARITLLTPNSNWYLQTASDADRFSI